jgi:dephospho-CoA kinase
MKRIGLTGGIGVGKSVVAQLFRDLGGVPVLDADQVARELRAPGGEAAEPVRRRFGTLDRTELRKLISSDPRSKQDLESILHPLIRKRSAEAMKALEAAHPGAPFLIYEASLLIESGRLADFDGLIVVTSPLPDRLSRIMARDGVSKEAALSMIDAQNADSYRLKHAHFLIENLGTLEDLKPQVLKVLDQIKSA